MPRIITQPATPAQSYAIPDELWDFAMMGWTEPDSDNPGKSKAEAEEGVKDWFLHSESPALNWRHPVDVLKEDEDGLEKVKKVLGAIIYGTYL